jgi:acetoin utilization deacetylase AcuC-like enzyme
MLELGMKKVGFVYDDVFLTHEMPAGHPESGDRLTAITDHLKETGLWNRLIHVKPRKAGKSDVLLVHTASYYEKISRFTGYFDADTYVSDHSVEAALFAVGAVLEAVDRCGDGTIREAFCAVRPPGHHAEANRAMGFCIFNNVAAGARYAQKAGYEKIFIADFDVHHGNGTQHIFEEDDTVFYFSTHQYPHYPGTGSGFEKGRGKGAGFTYNIPMHAGAGDKDYLEAYDEVLPGLLRDFSADMVIVSAGYDLHSRDPLAGIMVSSEGIRGIVSSILHAAGGKPCIFCLEGGYNLVSLAESVGITLEEMLNPG